MSVPKDPGIVYSELAKDRYHLKMAGMTIPPELKEWAGFMTARYGKTVRLHFSDYTDWVLALMIVRWGEAEEKWPTELTKADILRAVSWYKGKTPEGVKYQSPSGMSQSMADMLS